MTVHTLHGIRTGAPAPFTDRNLVAESALAAWLEGRRLVPLEEALEGSGEALTIDDATHASAAAARLVASAGQPVTLFVNPGDVLDGHPPDLKLVDDALDRTSRTEVHWPGTGDARIHPLHDHSSRKSFRGRVKRELALLADPAARRSLAVAVAEALGVPAPAPPRRVCLLTVPELRQLQAEGVTLGNHGWNHLDHCALRPAAAAEQVARARRWLRDEMGVESPCFAVPFGRMHPPRRAGPVACTHWLLNTSLVRPGALRSSAPPALYNRPELRL